MCGYCTEEIALATLRSDIQGNLQMKDLGSNLRRYFYLRETPDFISGLDSLKRSLAHKRLSFFTEVPHTVLLYRGIEILLEHGFESPAYQKLLKQSLYREAIATLCSDENRKDLESATAGRNIEHLGMLYDAETFFWGERCKQLRTLAYILPSCRNMLKHYVSWWLDGKDLKKADENSVTKEEEARFSLLFRAVYFSVLMVGSCSAGKKMLAAVAQRNPIGTPAFEGEDLWLQRIAALKLYNLEGFDTFLKRLTTIRATNFYYLDIEHNFSLEQKQLLLDEVRRYPEAETADNFTSLSRWLSNELENKT
jgi:hypothetical protein